MRFKKITKWLGYVGLILILLASATIGFIDYELNHMYGGHTEKVDHLLHNVTPKTVAVSNVNVLSPEGNQFISGQNVLIDKGKIISVDTSAIVAKNTTIIDGREKYLIPGLIDSHVHLWKSENDLLLYIANGVTQIREMNGSDDILIWKKEIENGRIGPRIFVTSKQVGTYGLFEGYFTEWTQKKINIRTPNEATNILETISGKGYDAVKVSSFLSKESYLAASKASKEVGIPLIGHLPNTVGLIELWNSNQKELAHVEELVKALDLEFGGYNSKNIKEFLSFVEKRSDQVASKLIENNIHVTSTLWLSESFSQQKTDLKRILSDVELKYANPGITEGTIITSRGMGWLPEVNIYRWPDDWAEENRRGSKTYWEAYFKAIEIVFKALVDKNVQILAGTDTNVPVVVPGFSIHDELITMTQSGMTPSQALQSATIIPAKWMKTNTGKIETGYDANLVLLNKNPLDDIANTKTIETVISNGKVMNRMVLDGILEAVEKANNRSRTKEIKPYIK